MTTRFFIASSLALLLSAPVFAQAKQAPQAPAPAQPPSIYLQFPATTEVGSLDSGLKTEILPFWRRDHKMAPVKAQGKVKLPKGVCLQLDVAWEGARDMSWMAKLGPDAGAIVVMDLKKLPLGDQQLMQIGKLSKAEQLYLDDTEVNDKQLAYIANIKELKGLRLCKTAVTGEGFIALAACKNLAVIDLANNALKANNLSALTKLPALISLRLENCALRDEDLKNLSAMPALKNLSLRSNRNITDKGLEHLVKIKTLTSIDLTGTSIDASAAATLKKIAQLKSITVSHKAFSDVAVEDFHKTLPEVKIKFAHGRDDIPMEVFRPLH